MGSAANSYEILAKLAMGGMAEIFLARGASAAGVERYCVLKRVLRERVRDDALVRMFMDEARLAAQLQHPNIAQVYDIGKLGDSYFFTMEYVHGETIRALMHRAYGLRRHIPIGSVLTIVAGAAAGLHHAHERKGMDGRHLGIVHRDVSPSNLMVSYEGTVKVVDFGVAKAASHDSETRPGTVKGKVSYMSPEQCRGGNIDRRSDLFALGIVMWEMLTTERLFRRTSDFENMQAIVSEIIPPPSTLRPEIPPAIDAVVMRLLDKSPDQRFQTAAELLEIVETAAASSGFAQSTSSLGRLLRELFGQRPEPWVELASQERHPEVFTVTSESAELDQVDQRLQAIPQLAQRAATDGSSPPGPVGFPTVPLVVHAELLPQVPRRAQTGDPNVASPLGAGSGQVHPIGAGTPPPELRHTPTPMPAQAFVPGAVPVAVPLVHTPSAGVVAAVPTPAPGSVAMHADPRAHTPSMTPPSNPGYPVIQSSALPHRISYPPGDQRFAPARTRRVVTWLVVAAIALGIVVGIVAGSGGQERPAPVARPSRDAGGEPRTGADADDSVRSDAPSMEPVAVAVAVASVDAAATAPVAEPPDAPTSRTAGPVAASPDAGPLDAASLDAGAPAAASLDAGALDAGRAAAGPGSDKASSGSTGRAQAAPGERARDVEALVTAQQFGAALGACAASAPVATAHAAACTVAACKLRDLARARRWFGAVGAARSL